MSDRIMLEQSEARELLGDYNNTTRKLGAESANAWLSKQWPKVLRKFGNGSVERVKSYMRQERDGQA